MEQIKSLEIAVVRISVFLVAAISIFSGVSFGGNCPTSSGDCFSDIYNIVMCEQGQLILLVLGVMVLAISVAFIYSKVFNSPRWSIWAKDEMFHLIFSVFLLVSFAGILWLSCAIMGGFFSLAVEQVEQSGGVPSNCYSPNLPISEISNCYVDKAISDVEDITDEYIQQYIRSNMHSTFSVGVYLPLITQYTLTLGAYQVVWAQQYNMIVNMFLIPMLISLKIQKLLLSFITENVIRWVLPIAFAFRVFAPTRSMGNGLIALSIGLYVLAPFIYTFNFVMYDVSSVSTCGNDGLVPPIYSGLCDNVADGGCDDPIVTCRNPFGFWAIARMLPMAFFLPNLTIAIIVTFVSSVNKALNVIG